MNKELVLQIRREVSRALRPTGLISRRGPALTIKCLIRKIVKDELRLYAKPPLEVNTEIGMSQ